MSMSPAIRLPTAAAGSCLMNVTLSTYAPAAEASCGTVVATMAIAATSTIVETNAME